MSAFLCPTFGSGYQAFNSQGVVLAGGLLYTYLAGTTTPQPTWTNSTQAIQNANPIVLGGNGRPSQEIWLQSGVKYKFVLMDANSVTQGTWDNVAGINDINAAASTEWQASNLTPTFFSTTSFTVSGNQTSVFAVNRRLQMSVSVGTLYGYVSASSYSAPNTTVTVVLDSGVLDSGLSSVSYGVLNSVNPSVPQQYLTTAGSSLTLSGTLGVTGAATVGSLVNNGLTDLSAAGAGQIKFPATQNPSANANTLDDYEEGTWTPGLSFGNLSVGLTLNNVFGFYTKVGNLVSIAGGMSISNVGSSTGSMRVTNLPFVPATSNGDFFGGVVRWTNFVSNTQMFVCCRPGDTGSVSTMLILGTGGTGSPSLLGMTNTDVNSTSSFKFSVTYPST